MRKPGFFGPLSLGLRDQARSNSITSALSVAAISSTVSSLTAAPSLVFNSWPLSVTLPRSTCSQAWRPVASWCHQLAIVERRRKMRASCG